MTMSCMDRVGITRSAWTVAVLLVLEAARVCGVADYCEGETFRAICDNNEVVVMTHAQYGRMALGRCLTADYGNIGCAGDVTDTMDAWCSGRRDCEVRVSSIVDAVRNTHQPCPRDLRSYLEGAYQCLRVTQPQENACARYSMAALNLSDVQEKTGYLSSLTTELTNAGSIACPWALTVPAGMRINFTLFDFATALRDPYSFDVCQQVYATIKDRDRVTTVQVCTGNRRVAHAYTSLSDSVEVRIFHPDTNTNPKYFVLKYEAVGCMDPEAPVNGWIERSDDVVIVRCNGTTHTWELRCHDNAWRGEIFSECPPDGYIFQTANQGQEPTVGEVLWSFVSEFSIVIIASIAVIIACAILTLGLICIKRRREVREEQRHAAKPPGGRGPAYYEAAHKVDPRIQSRGVPGLPGEAFPPTENDYYRTWQLQRHAQTPGSQYGAQNYLGGAPHSPGMGSSYQPEPESPFSYQGHVEHIYESPKFARKEMDLQYYELDPDLTLPSQDNDRRRSSALSGAL